MRYVRGIVLGLFLGPICLAQNNSINISRLLHHPKPAPRTEHHRASKKKKTHSRRHHREAPAPTPTPQPTPPPAPVKRASIILQSPIACEVTLDGGSPIHLLPNHLRKLNVAPGDHQLEATAKDLPALDETISLDNGDQRYLGLFPAGAPPAAPQPTPVPGPGVLKPWNPVLHSIGTGPATPPVTTPTSPTSATNALLVFKKKQAALRRAMLADQRKQAEENVAAADRQLAAGAQRLVGGVTYVWIPAGTFQMGCASGDNRCVAAEQPQHPVTLTKGFWIGKDDVTVQNYQDFANATGRAMPDPPVAPNKDKSFNPGWSKTHRPMVNIAYADAAAYCRSVHFSQSGLVFSGRLPTEAQWERAARGGQDDQIYTSGKHISRNDANYGKSSCCGGDTGGNDHWKYTSPVGSFPANAYGLTDMEGNVWQYTRDGFYSYGSQPVQDPYQPAAAGIHVLRGGSWYDPRKDLRLSMRQADDGTDPPVAIGFRCVIPGLG